MAKTRLELSAPETAELAIEGREFAVRIGADLDVEVMAEILRLSGEFRRYGMKSPERLADWVERAKGLIFKVIEEQNPSEEDLAFARRRGYSPSEAFQILTMFSGNPDGAEVEVADALSEGLDEKTAQGDPADPTTSQKRSRSRSSRSARRSTSGPRTGEDSDGETSSSTLATSIAV